jgi:adenosylcobyric acid synthase
VDKNGERICIEDGAINIEGNVMGTYIHGVFDGVDFREYIINKIRLQKGMKYKSSITYENLREKELDTLADIVRQNMDINKLYDIMGIKR